MVFKNLVLITFALIVASCASSTRVAKRPISISSWKDLKDSNIVMQQRDYSCGPSAVVTLLNNYFDDKLTEKIFLDRANEIMSEKAIKNAKVDGLSMKDLKMVAESFNYQSLGARIPLKSLIAANVPVVVFVQDRISEHFALFAGYDKGFVHLKDPSRGNIYLTKYQFAKEYLEKALIIQKSGKYPPKLKKDDPNHSPLAPFALQAVRLFLGT